ncbi:transglutaminase-like domain-containing protein, partial [Sphaerisporangium sp. B11E5]|uniref:transglutaminase-like domain-containing protein n=1 Tax=Sphaerisporangium sp. B11E5 TaxID=3153563 RepID=UPI00325E4238
MNDRAGGDRVLGVALATLLGLAPMVAFAGVFGRTPGEALGDARYVLPVAGAAAVTGAVCLLAGAAARLAPVTRLTLGLAGLVTYLALVVPSRAFEGPRLLVTSVPPLDPSGAELATVAFVSGAAALSAAEAVLRGKGAVWATPVPIAGVAAGLAVAGPAGTAGWLAPALAAVCAALLALRARPARAGVSGAVPAGARSPDGAGRTAVASPDGAGRTTAASPGGVWRAVMAVPGGAWRAVVAVPLVAGGVAAGLLGPALVAVLPGRAEPADVRELVPQAVRPRQGVSPLSQFPAIRSGKLPVRLRVTTGARPPARLRFATLTGFDGTYWTSTATFWRAGTRLPAPPDGGAATTTVETRVRLDEAGPLGMVLSVGRPLQVSLPGLGVDPDTGDVALPGDRPAPGEYTVRGAVPVVDPAALSKDRPVTVPGTDQAVAGLAGDARRIAGDRHDLAALRRLAGHFADGAFAVESGPRAPGGHGIFQIRRLLESRRGTAEQYASAFAEMARALGYDVRVVVGFTVGRPGRPVTGQQIDAWAEVRFAASGWVAFHPAPARQGGAPEQEIPEESPPEPSSAPAGEPEPAASRAGGAPGAQGAPGGPWAVVPVVAALVALAGLVAAVPLLKLAVRTRRRRVGDPMRRVAGAWRDTMERYADAGVPIPASATTGEATAHATSRFPTLAAPLATLAALVDRTLY